MGKLMKRIASMIFVLLFLFGLTAFATVSADVNPDNSKLVKNSPKVFYAYGFQYIASSDEVPPFHRLQNLIDFEFNDKQEVHRQYTVEYQEGSSYGPATHNLDLYLTHNKTLLNEGSPFISGRFSYIWEHNGEINEYTGTVEGQMIEIATDIMGFSTDYVYTNALALDLNVSGDPWDWTIYLEVPGEEDYYIGSTYIEEDYFEGEESPHVPSPSTQADVAAGVGISTVGIAAANALTKTSMLGSTSFNINVSPATPASAASSQAASTSGGSGFFGTIINFFKNLFANLRDMLTDEGRSFASGRVSDFLEDTDLDNTGDDN